MTIGEMIRNELVLNPAVLELVSGRIFPNELPQQTALPAICYSIVSGVPELSFDGSVSSRLRNVRVQIDCYARAVSGGATAYEGAHAVADAVNEVIGNLARPELSASLEVERDLFDNVTQYHRVSMDFSVWA